MGEGGGRLEVSVGVEVLSWWWCGGVDGEMKLEKRKVVKKGNQKGKGREKRKV